jgi:hypothetical protein
MGKENFGTHLSDNPIIALLLILLVTQMHTSKFFNPAFHHLINPMDLSFKIWTLLFSKEYLLIMG